MKTSNSFFGKMLYGLLFTIALPMLLWYWARQTESAVHYKAVHAPGWGIGLSTAGLILIGWGILALWRYGHGLPMNAYPPDAFVTRGPYRLFRHPIYWGFGFFVAGVSLAVGSASGLWLVTPVTALGMAALVWGYERLDLQERFPGAEMQTWLAAPPAKPGPPSRRDRLAVCFQVLVVLFLGNSLVQHLEGTAVLLSDWHPAFHPLFQGVPFYLFSLVFVGAVPFVLNRQDQLRSWALSGLVSMAASVYLALVWPAVGTAVFPPDFSPGVSREFLSVVPVFLIWLSMQAYWQRYGRWAILLWITGLFLTVFHLANSRSLVAQLPAAAGIWLVAVYYRQAWGFLRMVSEQIANSWKEWVFGPVRVINHGFYVGIGTFLGILLSGYLAGPAYAWVLLCFVVANLIISALWAQLIEGSEKLKRPFGYYGAIAGIVLTAPVVWALGYNVWVILGVLSVVMPWGQALGRLRCLVNGCCHGSPTHNAVLGIRYFHPRSRVCGLSNLKGELLHPTPLYAFVWLFFCGFVLLALWLNQLPYSFIFGMYLILTGMGRFVEEAYRGEVQTVVWNGLRLYQWIAIASVLVGIGITMVPVQAVALSPGLEWETAWAALIGGLFTFFAMGVDFPRSNARFSRLV